MLGEALAIGSLVLFGANVFVVGAASRRVPQDVGFLLGLASNVGLASLVVLGQYLMVGRSMAPPEWDALGFFALGGLLTSYVGRWFFFRSVHTIGATRASALQVTNPVFAALAAWVLLGEALPPSAILAGGAVLLGLYLTSRPAGRPAEAAVPGGRSLPPLEVWLALLGALSYGLGNVARGTGVRDWAAPVVGSLVGAAVGLLLHAVVSSRRGDVVAPLRGADPVGRRLWLLSGALTISAQTCLIAASLYVPVAVAVVISAALPIVVLPVSVLVLRRTEAVGWRAALGALVVLAGVAGLVLG